MKIRALWSQERSDLRILAVLILLIPLTWLLCLGWNPSLLISGNDGVAGTQPNLKSFLELGGSWKNTIYLFSPLGGALGEDATGIIPFYEWMSALKINHFAIEILLVFFLQTLVGFLGYKIFHGFWSILSVPASGKKSELHWGWFLLVAWSAAFQAFMGWRIFYGHEILLQGLLVFLAGFSLLVAVFSAHLNLTTLCIAILALINSFCSSGQQLVVYGAVFGFPILLGLSVDLVQLDRKRYLRAAGITLIVAMGSFLLVSPRFLSMFQTARGGEMARSISGASLTYSYVTATWHDLLSSVPANLTWFPPDSISYKWHEVNLGFGFGLLVILALWKSRLRFLLAGMLFSFSIGWLFAMNFAPISTLLLKGLPVLNSFRVPHRALMPLAIILAPTAFAAILARVFAGRNHWISGRWIPMTALVLAFAVFPAGGAIIELLGWTMAVALFVLPRKASLMKVSEVLGFAVLAILAGSQLLGFSERALPYMEVQSMKDYMQQIRSAVTQLDPEMANPLNRGKLLFGHPNLHANSIFGAGVSSIEGYMSPLGRFSRLVFSLQGRPYDSTINAFYFDKEDPAFKVLGKLYNIKNFISLDGGKIALSPNPDALGTSWFPTQFKSVPHLESLSATLRSPEFQDSSLLRNNAYVLQEDVPAWLKMDYGQCTAARVSEIKASYFDPQITLRATSPGECILVLPLNYSKKLKVTNPSGAVLESFPVYGALLGIRLPGGNQEVRLVGTQLGSRGLALLPWIGLLLVLGLMGVVIRNAGSSAPAKI